MNSSAGGSPQQNSDKQDMSYSGGMAVVDSVCHFNGATTTSHAEITGDMIMANDMKMNVLDLRAPGGAPRLPPR